MATAEDPMELSSEMNPPANVEDIDIDVLTSDVPQEGEDDFMAEDVISVTDQELPDIDPPHAGNDDEMFDDEYPTAEYQEYSSAHDEDLDDAEEPATGDSADTTITTSEDNIEGHHNPEEEGADVDCASANVHESNLQGLEDMQKPASLSGLAEEHNQSNVDPKSPSLHDNYTFEDPEEKPVTPDNSKGNAEGPYDQQPEDLDETLNAQEGEEEPSGMPPVIQALNADQEVLIATNTDLSQTSPYMHPVIVVYQNNEMSLFPPIEQEQEQSQTYFLQDEAYAAGSINNLLGACRSVLGDSIGEQDELEIQIAELGLHISEFAPESSTTTLAKILDVYVTLHHHDGIDSPGPLYIALCTKIRFSHRMNYLINAAAEGKGFSQLPLLEPPDEDDPQSEVSEKQDSVSRDDLQNTDISTFAEVEDIQPVVFETRDGNKDDDEVQINQTIAGNTLNDLEAPNIHPPDGSTSVENEAESTQLSSMEGDVSSSKKAGPNGEQRSMSKVGQEIGASSSVGLTEDATARSEDTAPEEENLINYEDEDGEDDVNHEFSTRSSTIQGDSIGTSNFDLATTTENVFNDELAESVNKQLQEDHDQQQYTGQAHNPNAGSGAFEREEVDIGAYDEILEVDSGEAETFEPEHDQGNEYSHEQVENSSPDDENEPEVQEESIHNGNPPFELGQTEAVSTYQSTKGYEDQHNQEEDRELHDPSSKNHENPHVGLKGDDDSHENAFDITLDHKDSGENTETSKVNATLSHGHGHDSEYSKSISTSHTIGGQDSYEKGLPSLDEINYEDEEKDVDFFTLPAEQSARGSPSSLKRMRCDEDGGLLYDDSQDLKRVRSS